ncbi:hypothetical protein Bca52824_006429 [Brassica carinata]|uniref:Uncharacterized protein n=1 Tax=Brassica carinata TaxID=52824 RepID=A0A8X7W5C2_BRACI|nr:hypothetical protein Bca52824_006429 [Brassica carinata]
MKKTCKFQSLFASLIFLILLSTLLSISRTDAVSSGVSCRHPPSQNSCKTCMVEQTKYGCPKCGPVLGCMARCLWGGVFRGNAPPHAVATPSPSPRCWSVNDVNWIIRDSTCEGVKLQGDFI